MTFFGVIHLNFGFFASENKVLGLKKLDFFLNLLILLSHPKCHFTLASILLLAGDMRFNCSHESEEPRNMGRGAARERRLAVYFDRLCRSCAIARITASVNSLTDRYGRPLSEATHRQHLTDRIRQLKY